MTTDDGWDLIADDLFSDFVQPSTKACPLPRPQHVLQPRLQAPFSMTMTGMPGSSSSGPRLTVAGLSAATPQGVPAFAPVRRDLLHHVSRVESPYTRVPRDEYYPKSLERVSQVGNVDWRFDMAPHGGSWGDSFVSQYTEKALTLSTVAEGWHSKGAHIESSDLNSHAIDAFKSDE